MYSSSMIKCQTFREDTRPLSHQLEQPVFFPRQQRPRQDPRAGAGTQAPDRNGSGHDCLSDAGVTSGAACHRSVPHPHCQERLDSGGLQGADLPTWLSPGRKFMSAINDNMHTQESLL